MSDAIIVENLSKEYRLGQMGHENMLREALARLVRNPFKRSKSEINTIWALNDVSFSVAQGEVVGIIGRNGAGKSTLLKLLSKITYPTSGSINVRGRIAALLEVGTGFHEELTGRENIYLNGSILGMKKSEIDRQLDAIIEFADVARFIETPIKRYSSGMRLRLGFAVAAHLAPDVLLVDEVLAVGDVSFQKKCINTMEDLRSGGRTVLFVSHNMAAVENLCSRAIWIDQGKVYRDGPASDIIREYMGSFSTASNSGSDLSDFRYRSGSGEIKITGIDVLDMDRQQNNLVRTGESLVLRMHFKANTTVSKAHFGVEFMTDMGTLITSVSTWHTGHNVPVIEPGTGYVDLEIESLNLMPSTYHLKTIVASEELPPHDVLDNCLQLEVEASDFYKSGRGIARKFGLVCFHCDWKIEQTGTDSQP